MAVQKSVYRRPKPIFAVKTHEREMQNNLYPCPDGTSILIRQDIKNIIQHYQKHITNWGVAKHLRTLLNSITQAIKVYMVAAVTRGNP